MRAGVHKPTYRSWQMMKNRCLNPKAEDYAYYGGRGVLLDPAWHTYEGFVADMGLRPDNTTIDREDGDGNYVASNCRWATRLTQSRNRDYTLDLSHEGKTQKVWEWAKELHVKQTTMHMRLWHFKRGAISYAQVFKQNPRGATA